MRGGGSAAWRLDAAEMNLVFAASPALSGAAPRTAERAAFASRRRHADHLPQRPGRRPAPDVRRRAARASFPSSPIRTSPAAASCSSASARRSPSAARTCSSSTPASAPARRARWRWSTSAHASSGCRRRSPTSPRAACAIRFVDAAGSTRGFLERAAEAAPGCDVVLVHAPASELCRMFAHGRRSRRRPSPAPTLPCPIVVADDRPASVTHAYAAMKLLAQRAGLVVSELLLGAAPQLAARRADRRQAGRLRRQLLRRRAARLGARSTRPATRASRPAATCAASSPPASRTHAAIGASVRPAARRRLPGAGQ